MIYVVPLTNRKERIKQLKRVEALITKGWTRGCSARDRQGQPVSPFSRRACRWCWHGAIAAAAKSRKDSDQLAYIFALCGIRNVIMYNDEFTKKMVLAEIRRAIRLVEGPSWLLPLITASS